MVVPIPDTTSDIRWLGVVGFRENADSFFKIVSLETSSTVTVFSMSLTLVGNWHTNSFSVKDIEVGAFQTFLVIPIPDSASEICWLSIV